MLSRTLQHLRRNVVLYLVLFAALSGTSYAAAMKLAPKNSVGSRQVINGSLQKVDLSKKATAALRGAPGLQGPQGAASLPAGRDPRLEVRLAVPRRRAAQARPFGVRSAQCYGQLEVRVTVFEVIGMPGTVGVLSESADVPEAVAE
jgi:hypothetical protein